MSQDEPAISRKEKKAQRDAERRKPSKKRKHAETEDAVEALTKSQVENDYVPLEKEPTQPEETVAKESTVKVKKRKRDIEVPAKEEDTQPQATSDSTKPSTKPKKRKVAKADSTTAEADQIDAAAAPAKPTKSRFILFIGNLPYTTTDASLQKHFEKLMPFTLRHRTDPKTKKSKGFAFLEFENYDRMKTCLKLYHHSMFDPAELIGGQGKGYGKGGRKINVELTAGGGGKAEGRKDKIRVKNVRLEEQRARRAELERKTKAEAEKKEGGKGEKAEGAKAEAAAALEAVDMGGMHPSRVARL